MKCTWKDCEAEALHECLDVNGKPWANLCEEHFKIHEDTLSAVLQEEPPSKDDIKKMLGAWVKAHGGAKPMSKRIF